MITSITSSHDLATVLNATPLTEADAAETPRDWLDGIWVNGTVYALDAEATTDTLAVLADGTAAARWSPKGEWCSGTHRTGPDSQAAHWCTADEDSWTWAGDVRGVTRDWRTVNVWDANGYSETQTYPTLDEAKAAFSREVAEVRAGSAPQVGEDTVRGLLAADADHGLYVSFADGTPKLYVLDGEDTEDDYALAVSREDLVDEVGQDPAAERIAEYLPALQELVDDATQTL